MNPSRNQTVDSNNNSSKKKYHSIALILLALSIILTPLVSSVVSSVALCKVSDLVKEKTSYQFWRQCDKAAVPNDQIAQLKRDIDGQQSKSVVYRDGNLVFGDGNKVDLGKISENTKIPSIKIVEDKLIIDKSTAGITKEELKTFLGIKSSSISNAPQVDLSGPQGVQGLTGVAGANGVNGTQGQKGDQGATGSQGIQGVIGSNGLNGKTVLNGIVEPLSTEGILGDFYINSTTGIIYGPKTNSGWGNGLSLVGQDGVIGATGLQGAQGIQGEIGIAGLNGLNGKSFLNGITSPDISNGDEGDFYFNTATD